MGTAKKPGWFLEVPCNSHKGINSLVGIVFFKVDLEKLKFFEVPFMILYRGV
jgi:hypothetical protein